MATEEQLPSLDAYLDTLEAAEQHYPCTYARTLTLVPPTTPVDQARVQEATEKLHSALQSGVDNGVSADYNVKITDV